MVPYVFREKPLCFHAFWLSESIFREYSHFFTENKYFVRFSSHPFAKPTSVNSTPGTILKNFCAPQKHPAAN